MAEWREISDRREPQLDGSVRLWFDLGGGRLRSCVVKRYQQDEATIARIGATLAAEASPPARRVYGSHDS